ncbi:MAG TPA: UDP-2,3-diacylglucosamine diphosphatase [Actinomycetota bacterium]|nr:UDP-2,3-diacylglucosamine diphosphatase [Actinomycetota bacterium]
MIIRVAEERLIVVSDLHLGNPASHAGTTFRSFLDYVRAEGFSLCLNGDGFEMLQTRFSRLIREALPLMTQLSRLRREGRRVYYIVGNHDIYVEHFLDEWLGNVCPFLNVTSGGKRIRIEHGHVYDPVFSRSPDFYESMTRLGGYFLFLHPDIYKAWDSVARSLDRQVRRVRGGKEGKDLVLYQRAAAEVLRRGFDTVIYGHTHRAETAHLENGLYVNSGNWMHGGSYVEIDRGHVELKQWIEG